MQIQTTLDITTSYIVNEEYMLQISTHKPNLVNLLSKKCYLRNNLTKMVKWFSKCMQAEEEEI